MAKKKITEKISNEILADDSFPNTSSSRLEKKLSAKTVKDALKIGLPVQLSDGGSLYFSVSEPNKGVWFMRGRLNGVAKRRVLGHEDMTLAEARALRDEERL